jgi:hypothetical protein
MSGTPVRPGTLSTAAVAALLEISVQTLLRNHQAGTFAVQPINIGSGARARYRWPIRDLETLGVLIVDAA